MVVAKEVTKLPEIREERGWKFRHLKRHERQQLLEITKRLEAYGSDSDAGISSSSKEM